MAIKGVSFANQVDVWTRKSRNRMTAVFQEATQQLIAEAQTSIPKGGKLPVDTGFLINSGTAALNSIPQGESKASKGYRDIEWDASPIAVVIASAQIGDRIVFGWTAAYARRLEYGFQGKDSLGREYNQQGYGFMRMAANRWPQIVNESMARVKAEVTR